MNNEYKAEVGFWTGLTIGLVCGSLVGGISLIGQGIWEHGEWSGRMKCLQENTNKDITNDR